MAWRRAQVENVSRPLPPCSRGFLHMHITSSLGQCQQLADLAAEFLERHRLFVVLEPITIRGLPTRRTLIVT